MSIANRRVAPGGFVGSVRKASDIRGFMAHMAEGRNVAWYLSEEAAIKRGKPGRPTPPGRNVSVHYTVEDDGEVVSMVPELRVAGSMNPAALRTDDGPYYGRSHLDAVLGAAGARNPNKYVIAIEVAGTAKKGPNAKQIASLVRLFRDCRKRYRRIRPLGHRDQQNVKPCPGGSKGMRVAFAAMGGHGADWKAPKPKPPKPPPPVVIVTPDPECVNVRSQLLVAQARIHELEDQVEAMQAAIAAAMDDLDPFAPGEQP